ncbi:MULTISPECIES: F0F1 ATP synthase subunit delta [Paenibacillus]|uniref:F0F1 ATP synthase subunit delta n=1 Tax=Paenibacillus TaxID=44249 RepID=UPI0022B91C16|nr:F0F1 ATP synthase subunit delta [Paenibacillus caseinilyticus]MCZ8523360.1 F0F1 ATP synthase subunit delta [Paenibacillus caseinilyticus]
MSQDTIVAKRYAKALFEIANEQGRIAQVEEELKAVVSTLKQNADFYKLIKHPAIGAAAKADMLKQVFTTSLSETTFNTLSLLIEKGREELLEAMVGYYVRIASEALNQANATVYTPVELNAEEQSHIASSFGKITGKQIRVTTVLDKSLLGGIRVRIGDRLYDGSLSGKLQRLERALNQSQAL